MLDQLIRFLNAPPGPQRRPDLRKVEQTGLITNFVDGIFITECQRPDLKKYENMTVGAIATFLAWRLSRAAAARAGIAIELSRLTEPIWFSVNLASATTMTTSA